MNELNELLRGLAELARQAVGLIAAMNGDLIAWTSSLPPVGVACLAALSLMAAVIGARRPMVRVVAGMAGAALGFAYAARFEPWLPFMHVSLRDLGLGLGIAFGVFGALTPEGIAFALGGLAFGALLASLFRSGERAYAFIPGFLIGGAIGVVGFPLIAAALASFGGGWVCAAALTALFPRATLGGYLRAHPWVPFAIGVAIGVSGFLGQMNGIRLRRLGGEAEEEGSSSRPGAKPARAVRAKARRRA